MLKYIAEFIGSFIFISIILAVSGNSKLSPLYIGIGLTSMILFCGHISGGHFNPAVSITMFINKTLSTNDLIFYIISQVIGGACAYQFSKMQLS